MTFNPVFIPVLSSIVEPNLKLRVAITDRRNGESDASVRVYYDPELLPSRITMPYPEELRRQLAKDGYEPPLKDVVFVSPESRQILTLSLQFRILNGNIKLWLPCGGRVIQNSALIIERSGVPTIAGHTYATLASIIKSLILIHEIDSEVDSENRTGNESVSLWLPKAAAEELAIKTTFSFDRTIQEDVLIAERRISS